jgi:hypothetical protein
MHNSAMAALAIIGVLSIDASLSACEQPLAPDRSRSVHQQLNDSKDHCGRNTKQEGSIRCFQRSQQSP